MGNYGELWGILGFYGVLWELWGILLLLLVSFLFLLCSFPTDMSNSNFHAFNNVLYVRLWHLYKPPKEYLSQGHLARVMKKLDIKCVNNTEIGLAHGGDVSSVPVRDSPPPPPPPPPLRALRAHLVTKGPWLLTIHMVAPKAPENFFSFPLPT